MNIDFKTRDDFSKSQLEKLEQEKQEFLLLNTFARTRGLKLFSYNSIKDELNEVLIKYGDTIHLVVINAKLTPVDFEQEKCYVDAKNYHFECLNYSSAQERIKKWKKGKINELSNLQKIKNNTINLY